ncbi:MAG: MurR/RpiR family transcriptional regulator [Lachnospiraceae bacterium]
MNKNADLLVFIKGKMPKFSKGQRAIARYILANYDKASYMTAAQLGQNSGVSESTVVRFANELGFDGYPQFQKRMAEYVSEKLSKVNRLELELDEMDSRQIADFVMANDMENIKKTWENLDKAALDEACESIIDARNVYIVAVRSCEALARLFEFYLNTVRKNVFLVTGSGLTEMFEKLMRVHNRDVVIGISFPRYSMGTIKALEFASDRNARIIAITDSKHSPLNLYSSCNLFAKSNMASVVDSFAAPISLINVLIVSICMKQKEEVLNNISMLEQIWKDYQVVQSDELDYLDEDNIKDFDQTEK